MAGRPPLLHRAHAAHADTPRTTSGEMLFGLAALSKSIERHIAPCSAKNLVAIALDLSAAGFTIAKERP